MPLLWRIARTILFDNRDERAKFYSDRQWFTAFVGGSHLFQDGAERLLDARTLMTSSTHRSWRNRADRNSSSPGFALHWRRPTLVR